VATNLLDQFELVHRLGAGGMAEVFLARKRGAEGTFKTLVVKRILPSHEASRRYRMMFIEEAMLATRLNHPNVVQVYEFFDAGEKGHVLVMEYVEGLNLGQMMQAARESGSKIGPWISAWIIAEAAKGLHYAHERKDEQGVPLEIVHRDISPQNILLSVDGSVKITDFGIASARLFEEDASVLKGKYAYMSPEQARGEKADRRSDLYSLGVVFWECLAGVQLHKGLAGEVLLETVRAGQVSGLPAHVPAPIATIVMKLLTARADDRFASGREVASALSRCLLEEQQLVDAAVLEHRIIELLPRLPAAAKSGIEELATNAAAPAALGRTDDGSENRPQAREVRHVVVVSLRLHARAPDARAVESLRKMLDEIAYKRGTQWKWKSRLEATAVAGLSAKHARAPFDAAELALDTHEALLGYQDDIEIEAAVSLVRGVAAGSRDPEGNLVRYRFEENTESFAERVIAETTPGKTWVAGGLYRLVRHSFAWGQVHELEPQGELRKKTKLHELLRSLSHAERDEIESGSIVGRHSERADLAAAYHSAVMHASGGTLVTRVVAGELGIGKTSLVNGFLQELAKTHSGAQTPRVIRAECTVETSDEPYGLIAELLRDTLAIDGDTPFEVLADRIASIGGGAAKGDANHPVVACLAEIAAKRRKAHAEEDLAERRKLALRGLRSLFAALSFEQPLVVVLENFQWADRTSLEIFSEILHAEEPLAILMLIVTRPDDRVGLTLEGNVRIDLEPLSTSEQVRLIEMRLGVKRGVSDACAELLTRAGGNPFFLLELVDALLERGVLEIHEERGGNVLVRTANVDLPLSLPQTLEQLLADRIHQLPREERVLSDWLAVAGGQLTRKDLLSLSTVLTEGPLLRLVDRGICELRLTPANLSDLELVSFRHPLIRDVVYGLLSERERRGMHGEVAELLSARIRRQGKADTQHASAVARHFEHSRDYEHAAEFFYVAAKDARDKHQTQLAATLLRKALSNFEEVPSRSSELRDVEESVLEGLESAYRTLGRARERKATLEALRLFAKRHAHVRCSALALARMSRYFLDEGRYEDGLSTVRAAVELAQQSGSRSLATETEALLSEFLRELGDVQGALAACDRALAACETDRGTARFPSETFAEVLRAKGVLLRRVGRVREAVDAYAEALAHAKTAGAKRLEARCKNALAYAMFVQARYEDAIALALESIQIDVAMSGRFQLAKTLTNIGFSYARLGDTARAAAYLNRARDAHVRYGDADSHADTLIVCAEVAIDLGQVDEAKERLAEAAMLGQRKYDVIHSLLVQASIHRFDRNPKDAILCALQARREAEEQALVSFSFYGFALEAAARVDAGEVHSGTLLATTALGAVEALQGCEYGLEIRALAADALKRAGSPQAAFAKQRAVDYAEALLLVTRDQRLKTSFCKRSLVSALFETTPVPL
jgi:eukaryotic-like serine/threonine-protein kinase